MNFSIGPAGALVLNIDFYGFATIATTFATSATVVAKVATTFATCATVVATFATTSATCNYNYVSDKTIQVDIVYVLHNHIICCDLV